MSETILDRIKGEADVDVKEAKELIEFTQTLTGPELVRAATLLGDLARGEENRTVLSQAGAVELVCNLLKTGPEEVKFPALRCIGNLTYEHADNVTAVVAQNVLPEVVAQLGSGEHQTMRAAAGAVGNLAHANESVQGTLLELGALTHTARLLQSGFEDVVHMTLRALNNLSEGGKLHAVGSTLVEPLLALLSNKETDEMAKRDLVEVLSHVVTDEASRALLIEKNFIQILTDATSAVYLDFDAENDPPDEESAAELAIALLQKLVERYDSIRSRLLPLGLLPRIHALFVTPPEQPNKIAQQKISRLAARVVASVAADDPTMVWYISQWDFVASMLKSKDQDVRTSAVMLVSNLARTKAHCLFLSDKEIPQLLLKFLNKYPNDQRLQLHVGATLRNLAIPLENKARLIEVGAMEALLKMITIKNRPIQFNAVGTLKILVTEYAGGAAALHEKGGLQQLMALWRGQFEPEPEEGEDPNRDPDRRVQMETGRLFSKLAAYPEAVEWIIQVDGIEAITDLLNSPHTVLHCDCATALANIGAREWRPLLPVLAKPSLATPTTAFLAKENMLPQERAVHNGTRAACLAVMLAAVAQGGMEAKLVVGSNPALKDACVQIVNCPVAENAPPQLKQMAQMILNFLV